jgi:hypothetical protein
MKQPESLLEELVSNAAWTPDWQGVLVRAGVAPTRRLLTRRRVIVALAAAAAVLIPLTALADANDWWFFRTPGSPTPTSAPVVVKTGAWDGHPWQLVAYPSETDGLCVSMIPGAGTESSYGAAMGCATLKGVPRTTQTKPATHDMTITYLSGSATSVLPAYVVGPVVEEATTVAIRLSNGTTIRTPTFAGPSPLEHVRFYAVQLPDSQLRSPTTNPPLHAMPMEWIAGLDQEGNVIACLAPATATNGISPLAACS